MNKINLHNIDCMKHMAKCEDNQYNLAIADPPYGMRGNVFQMKSKNLLKEGQTSARLDDKNSSIEFNLQPPPQEEYFNELFRVSKNQIIFGMQYFVKYLPSHQCVIVWDKKNGGNYFSDAEIAWTSFDTATRIIRIHNPTNNRIHPTQKPIKLYRKILLDYAKVGDKILDTHGGSMSMAIACHIEKFALDLCEIDKDFFFEGKIRYNEAIKQKRLSFNP